MILGCSSRTDGRHRPDLYVIDSCIHGKGVCCRSKLAKGSFIGFYTGEIVSHGRYTAMCSKNPKWCSYGFGIAGTGCVVVATSDDDILGFVNEVPQGHVANVVVLPLHLDQGNALGYFAATVIDPGTELMTHYGAQYQRAYRVGTPAPHLRKEQLVHSAIHIRSYHTFCAKRQRQRRDA